MIQRFLAWLRDLFRRPDPRLHRLQRLRRLYRSDKFASPTHNLFRAILREHVPQSHWAYYDRALRFEVESERLATTLPRGIDGDALIAQIHALTERVSLLVEQVGSAQRLASMSATVPDVSGTLIARVEELLTLQEQVVGEMMDVIAASNERNLAKMRHTLDDITSRLSDVADSYTEAAERYTQRLRQNTDTQDQ
jgi:uncharacterized coiled-coil protein SlyX